LRFDDGVRQRAHPGQSVCPIAAQPVAGSERTRRGVADLRRGLSPQTRTLSGRSSAASGAATITGVPAVGLPKMTSFYRAARALGFVASPLRSITANIFIFLASTTAASRVTVSATELLCAPLRLACCARMWEKYAGNRLNASSI
jgi:hypothetical protein